MNLGQLRAEVEAHGFDANQYGARINNYLNDAYMLACRRVDYYIDEASFDFSTVNGTIKYAFPADFARIRDVWDTTRNIRLMPTTLREIDNSGVPGTGAPQYYALDGSNFHIWPTPDGVYTLETRYWKLPALLSADTDTPNLPADWHRLLAEYAIARCFWGDDDAQMGQAWDQKWQMTLAEFAADQKFPDSETPDVATSMWDQERGLTQKGWSLWGWL